MDHAEMRSMEKTHCCGECRSVLVTKWDDAIGYYDLVCAKNAAHRGFTKILSASQAVARGEGDRISGPGTQKSFEDVAAVNSDRLLMLPLKDIATGKTLPDEAIKSLILWAEARGLSAFLGHGCYYHSQPYVTVDGYYYLNNKRPEPYRIISRPLNDKERKAAQVEKGDHAWIAEAYGAGKLPIATGLGIVTEDEIEAKSTRDPSQFRAPVAHDKPQRMAEKRAEWQLLHKIMSLEVIK